MFHCLTTKDLTNKKLFRPHAMRSEFCWSMDEGNNPSKEYVRYSEYSAP